MKVLFFGNQDNNAFKVARWMRDLEVDTTLYLISRFSTKRSLPELVAPEFLNNYPDWIHQYDPPVGNWWYDDREFFAKLEDEHDIIVTSGTSGAFAANAFIKKPVFHWSLGNEVTLTPLSLFSPSEDRRRGRERSIYTYLGLKNASQIMTDFRPNMDTLSQLGLLKNVYFNVFPEDIDRNFAERDESFIDELETVFKDKKIVYIWVSRLNSDKKDFGSYKAAEIYAESLIEFINRSESKDVGFLVLDHGYQATEFKKMLEVHGVLDRIHILPSQPHSKLLSILSLKKGVLFDCMDGVKGEIGGATREALSLGMPCFRTYDTNLIEMGYGEIPPLTNISNKKDCVNKMVELSQASEESLAALRMQVKEWSLRRLHYPNKIKEIILHFKKLVYIHQSSPSKSPDFNAEVKKVKKLSQLAHSKFFEKQNIPYDKNIEQWVKELGYPTDLFHAFWQGSVDDKPAASSNMIDSKKALPQPGGKIQWIKNSLRNMTNF